MIKYGTIEYSFRYGTGNFLQAQILDDNLTDIKEAEDRRMFWLNQDQSINPQNIQVFQYAE